MSGMAGRSGRKTFVPSPEQRNNVKVLTALGLPQQQICLLVINPQTGKPLDEKALRKHFEREIATGATELFAPMGNFIVANIFGMAPPAGTVAIDNQHVRRSLAIFFAKTRMGWKETMVNRQKEHPGAPIEDQDEEEIRQEFLDKINRISQSLNEGKPGASSEG
jgi:hypothetical protein